MKPSDSRDALEKVGRSRQQWGGLKGPIKRVVALPLVNPLVALALPLVKPSARRERLPTPVTVRAVRAQMAGVTFAMVDPARCVIAKELWWGRGVRPRPEDQGALDTFAVLSRTAALVIDVGAYTGIFSLLAARVNATARVHAFEIIPEVFKAAFDNVVANDLASRVRLHHRGVGGQDCTTTVPIGAGGSALPDFHAIGSAATDGVDVSVVRLDSLNLDKELPDDASVLMKIDVEGSEHDVLAGSRALIAARQPTILCELLLGARWRAVQDILDPVGYNYFLVTDRGLRQCDQPEPDELFRDWLFATKTGPQLRDLGLNVLP